MTRIDPAILSTMQVLGLYAVIAFGFLMLGVTIAMSIIFWKGNLSGDSIAKIVQQSDAPRLATIILIIMSTSALAVIGIIQGDAVIALLSGIAGYVLGNQTSSERRSED